MENQQRSLETMGKVNKDFWKNKKVFISGNTGFKGSWLSYWLLTMGAEVTGYSLAPEEDRNLFSILNLKDNTDCHFGDIRDGDSFKKIVKRSNFDIAFHLAAQPLVNESYANPYDTFSTNIIGTINFFEALRHIDEDKIAINVTSDKCYENDNEEKSFKESDRLGGSDPYSCSKGCAELITNSYNKSYFNKENSNQNIFMASVRAGNVIGGGDWARDRLIPDVITSFINNKKPIIRNPNSVRPWQFVLEPLSGYLMLAEKIYDSKNSIYCSGWNFGPKDYDLKTVEWIVDYIDSSWPEKVGWTKPEKEPLPEAKYLELNCDKAQDLLSWEPKLTLKETLDNLIDWYLSCKNGEDMETITLRQINEYIQCS